MPTQLPQLDSLNFNSDSAKVALTNIAQEIATDPNKFIQDLIHDAISFGLKVLTGQLSAVAQRLTSLQESAAMRW